MVGKSSSDLRMELRRLGLRQVDLATAAGVSEGYVSGVLRGERPPSQRLLDALERLRDAAVTRRDAELGAGAERPTPGERTTPGEIEQDLMQVVLKVRRLQQRPDEALHDLLDEVLASVPEARPRMRGYLEALLHSASVRK